MIFMIRAIPNRVSGPMPPFEHYFDLTGLKSEKKEAIRNELAEQGFLVQEIYVEDPLVVLMHSEVRAKMKAEQTP